MAAVNFQKCLRLIEKFNCMRLNGRRAVYCLRLSFFLSEVREKQLFSLLFLFFEIFVSKKIYFLSLKNLILDFFSIVNKGTFFNY